jgi:hypothetical protein
MAFLLLLAFLIVAGLWLLREFAVQGAAEDRPWPLQLNGPLSERERVLHRRLTDLFPDHIVFAQFALSPQLITLQPGAAEKESIRGKYKQLVVDFVLCRRDFTVVALIELDDASHARPEQRDRDARKVKAIRSAGLRLVRLMWPVVPDKQLQALISGDAGADAATIHKSVSQSTRASENAAILRPIVGLGFVAAVIGCGWMGITHMVASTAEVHSGLKLQPLGTLPQAVITTIRPALQASAALVPHQSDIDKQARSREEEARAAMELRTLVAEQTKRKEDAWKAYFPLPANCEHPPAWKDQVECGNQYIRAKKAFENQWSAQVNSQNGNAGLVQNTP